VTDQWKGEVRILDSNLSDSLGTIPVGNDPITLTPSVDGARIFVANRADHTVSIPDVASQTTFDTFSTGPFTNPMVLMPDPDGTGLRFDGTPVGRSLAVRVRSARAGRYGTPPGKRDPQRYLIRRAPSCQGAPGYTAPVPGRAVRLIDAALPSCNGAHLFYDLKGFAWPPDLRT